MGIILREEGQKEIVEFPPRPVDAQTLHCELDSFISFERTEPGWTLDRTEQDRTKQDITA